MLMETQTYLRDDNAAPCNNILKENLINICEIVPLEVLDYLKDIYGIDVVLHREFDPTSTKTAKQDKYVLDFNNVPLMIMMKSAKKEKGLMCYNQDGENVNEKKDS